MPAQADFDDAISRPRTGLVPAELKSGQPVMITQGPRNKPLLQFQVPWTKSGSKAVVYKFRVSPTDTRAIRCLFNEVTKPTEARYRQLSLRLRRSLSGMFVDFAYIPQGIVVKSSGKPNPTTYPIIQMEFIDGETLREAVARLCSRKDAPTLAALSTRWIQLVSAMDALSIAHGDLSSENVMVRADGSLVLVDYDGVYCDDDVLRKHPPEEAGNPDFQHPKRRTAGEYNERMDDFSALVIYVALRALEERPQLFRKFVEHDGGTVKGENLLFKEEDFGAPSTSELFKELEQSKVPELLRLTTALKNACRGGLAQVPRFTHLVDPTSALGALAASVPTPWSKIRDEAGRLTSQNVSINDSQLRALVDEARKRCNALDTLKDEIDKQFRDVRRIKVEYEQPGIQSLLSNWADATPYVEECEIALQQVERLDELEATAKVDPGRRRVKELWDRYGSSLTNCEEAEHWKRELQFWEPRIKACEALFRLVENHPKPWPSDLTVAQAWRALEAAGGHPDAAPYERDVKQCMLRADCLLAVRTLTARRIDESSDRDLVAVWDDALLAQCPDVSRPERDRYRDSLESVAAMDRVDETIALVDGGGSSNEQAIIAAAAAASGLLPTNYIQQNKDRTKRAEAARLRVATEASLSEALKQPISDVRLANAWSEFRDAWRDAKSKSRFVPPLNRIDLAIRRAPILKSLEAIMLRCPSEQEHTEQDDREMTTVWKPEYFQETKLSATFCHDLDERCRARIEDAEKRLEDMAALRSAIDKVDRLRKGAAADIELAGEKLPPWYLARDGLSSERARLERAVSQAAFTRDLKKAIATNSDAAIARAWSDLHNAGGDPAADPHFPRASRAVRRRQGQREIEEVLNAQPAADEQDVQLCKVWRDHDLAGSEDRDVRDQIPRIELAKFRTDTWGKFETALDSNHALDVCSLYNEFSTDRRVTQYPPYLRRQREIEQMVDKANAALQMLDALERNEKALFHETFDFRWVDLLASEAEYRTKLLSLWQRLIDFIRERVLPAFPFRRNPFSPTPLAIDGGTQIRLTWEWTPCVGKISHCRVAARWDETPSELDESVPTSTALSEQEFADSDSWATVMLPPGPGNTLHLAVWPVVQLQACGRIERIVGSPLGFSITANQLAEQLKPDARQRPKSIVERMLRIVEG